MKCWQCHLNRSPQQFPCYNAILTFMMYAATSQVLLPLEGLSVFYQKQTVLPPKSSPKLLPSFTASHVCSDLLSPIAVCLLRWNLWSFLSNEDNSKVVPLCSTSRIRLPAVTHPTQVSLPKEEILMQPLKCKKEQWEDIPPNCFYVLPPCRHLCCSLLHFRFICQERDFLVPPNKHISCPVQSLPKSCFFISPLCLTSPQFFLSPYNICMPREGFLVLYNKHRHCCHATNSSPKMHLCQCWPPCIFSAHVKFFIWE